MVWNIFYFHPYLGKIPILTDIFQRGWNHQPEITCYGVSHVVDHIIMLPSSKSEESLGADGGWWGVGGEDDVIT